ncbi:GTP pyrophosphokinase family protein [Corynebacterium felinum]|uniref:PpGpp synthetase/RelA/SpoT-type nucleotidyltransferase n=1 Tax=Corynebacterium felinum TaxID=131318 RepID=A0ABU2BBU9_9CORY|nr:GTP pyrophosphokinase family protein [Corynebacterium felinum]MDF5819522.1 GTP pyrophosphokinase family protein [Corynebacterium felinum]MDR7356095.1 ppGpp synthetase/RelA/SpoT-type nucleotidyltransferase [Corynebacterium felinum]WJY95429.1 GTP pyrophosphokinase YwaC [Corynebacterium felinum]
MSTLSDLHNRYQEFVAAHPSAVMDFADAVEDVLNDAGLAFDQVSVRIKQWRSLRAKAKKKRADGQLLYPDPWNDIHDVVGVRITTYHSTEIPQIIDALQDEFEVLRSVDKAAQTRVSGSFGYGSHHLILRVDARAASLAAYEGVEFEVQIRTVLQHAWAEFEHDIRYKRREGTLPPEVDRAFTLAAGLIELADQQFDQIAALEEPNALSTDLDVEFSAETLPGIIAMIQGNRIPQSRISSYQWLEELLHAHGIRTAGQLKDLLTDRNIEKVRRALRYRFQPGQVRILDDLLLAKFGEQHIERTATTGKREQRLRSNLEALKGVL